jgi:4-hydroxybenzoate polyprenyltransferase
MAYQQWLIRARDREGCFAGFINSHWVGVAVWFGLILAYL